MGLPEGGCVGCDEALRGGPLFGAPRAEGKGVVRHLLQNTDEGEGAYGAYGKGAAKGGGLRGDWDGLVAVPTLLPQWQEVLREGVVQSSGSPLHG